MIEACAIYLPVDAVDFKRLLPGGRTNGGFFSRVTRYDYPSPDGLLQLNVMAAEEIAQHLRGLNGYVLQLENTDLAKARAQDLIAGVCTVVGVVLENPIDETSEAFRRLRAFASGLGGFIFVRDSILTADGYLVGPMSRPTAAMTPAATVQIDPGDREPAPPHLDAIRERSIVALKTAGFECAPGLPLSDTLSPRPAEEIAARLGALATLFYYVAASEDQIPEAELRSTLEEQGLGSALTGAEHRIMAMPRALAHRTNGDTIGWKTENMWPLAWVLGFEPAPSLERRQLTADEIRSLLDFAPGTNGTVAAFLATHEMRSAADIAAMEDLFYCAHNAVRSAQLGSPTVPSDFDPIADGGAVHERRHALTWMLSPGVDWDDTDLST